MNDTTKEAELLCTWPHHCYESRVSGSKYCENHLLQQQVQELRPLAQGSLAALIRKANKQGLLKPVSAYAGN